MRECFNSSVAFSFLKRSEVRSKIVDYCVLKHKVNYNLLPCNILDKDSELVRIVFHIFAYSVRYYLDPFNN